MHVHSRYIQQTKALDSPMAHRATFPWPCVLGKNWPHNLGKGQLTGEFSSADFCSLNCSWWRDPSRGDPFGFLCHFLAEVQDKGVSTIFAPVLLKERHFNFQRLTSFLKWKRKSTCVNDGKLMLSEKVGLGKTVKTPR